MPSRIIIPAFMLIAAFPATGQVGRIPPNAIDRATAADDARRASNANASVADRDRAARDARDLAARIGPVPQSTMTDRVSGLNGSLNPPATAAPSAPPLATPN